MLGRQADSLSALDIYANYLTFLSLSFPICKIGIIIIPTPIVLLQGLNEIMYAVVPAI